MNQGQEIRLPVSSGDAGCMLVEYLSAKKSWFRGEDPASYLERGLFTIDGKTAAGTDVLDPGCTLVFHKPPWREPAAPAKIEILFDGPDLLVADKPAGIPVTPCGRFYEHSLLHILRKTTGNRLLSPLHRLDLETSGVIAFAKTKEARSIFQRQFSNGTAVKCYHALVHGHVPADLERIALPLGRDRHIYTKFVHDPNGKPALTEIREIRYWREFSLLTLVPVTGRTNQIRAHLAGIGYPIAGDKKYSVAKDLFLRLVENGDWEDLPFELPLIHQALHCNALGLSISGSVTYFHSAVDAAGAWRSQILSKAAE